jgi:hypothetical protein
MTLVYTNATFIWNMSSRREPSKQQNQLQEVRDLIGNQVSTRGNCANGCSHSSCLFCEQMGRSQKISSSHCVYCCNICEHCGRRGHSLYSPDGSYQCRELQVCERCTEKGHLEQTCRRDFCETCRYDGLGHNFVGHTVDHCRKHHVCSICNTLGHLEERCKQSHTCSKCERIGHTTIMCDNDVTCTICQKFGHSSKRCHACKTCGFSMPTKNPKDAKWVHKCKRDTNGHCKQCGGKGVGKCQCYNYSKMTK